MADDLKFNSVELSAARDRIGFLIKIGSALDGTDPNLAQTARDGQAFIDAYDRMREQMERVYQVGRGPHVGIAREALDE